MLLLCRFIYIYLVAKYYLVAFLSFSKALAIYIKLQHEMYLEATTEGLL